MNDYVHDDKWHHVAAVVSGSGNRLYVDGDAAPVTYAYGNASSTYFFDDVPALDTMAVGRNVDSGGPQWYFDGRIDEVAVLSRALEAEEVRALAAGASPLALGKGLPRHISTWRPPRLKRVISSCQLCAPCSRVLRRV